MKNAIRKMLLSYVAIAAICVGAGNANGDLFQFSFDDHNGNSGYGILEASPSTRGDGSYLATSGNLTLTSTISSLDGTYNLIPVGETSPFGLPNDGVFIADDIFFPSNNAGNGIATGVYNSSFLTQWGGLIFGSNPGTEFELKAENQGRGQYGFLGSYGAGNGYFFNPSSDSTTFSLSLVPPVGPSVIAPEPSSFALLGLGGIGLAMSVYRRRRMASV